MLITFLIILLASCKKNKEDAAGPATDFEQIFESYWSQMNTKYMYWDIDTTNWDNTYVKYKPLFKALDISKDADIIKSQEYFAEMSASLIDSHFVLHFDSPLISQSDFYPALVRKSKRSDFHSPFPYLKIDSSYFDAGYLTGTYITSDSLRMTTACAFIHKNILYFNCDRFGLEEAYLSKGNRAKSCIDFFFDQLTNHSESVSKVIIDVRNNPGGNIEDLNFLIGHLISKPLKLGYTRYKTGLSKLGYTPWNEAIIQPSSNINKLSIPIIVLGDSFTISLAEAIVMAIHELPDGHFIGEQTWGATGPVASGYLYYGGPFAVSNFMNVTESSAEFKYVDGKIYEGIGFKPDFVVPFDLTKLELHHDTILEQAIFL